VQPDPKKLLDIAGVTLPPIGLYDADDPAPFAPTVSPKEGRWACVFMFYKRWLEGETLHITADNFGCGGAGTYLCDRQTRTREEYIDFLYGEEGLKADREIMARWIDGTHHYRPEHGNLFLGPLRADQYAHLKTVTFFVNPDQLTLLLTGAHYRHAPGDPSSGDRPSGDRPSVGQPPVIAPFASGCGQLVALFDDLDAPQAMIGATDIAMRKFLPPDILAFTVTRPMFEQLCSLDENSFLYKPFWQGLREARAR
jgi:hypothetical protein